MFEAFKEGEAFGEMINSEEGETAPVLEEGEDMEAEGDI